MLFVVVVVVSMCFVAFRCGCVSVCLFLVCVMICFALWLLVAFAVRLLCWLCMCACGVRCLCVVLFCIVVCVGVVLLCGVCYVVVVWLLCCVGMFQLCCSCFVCCVAVRVACGTLCSGVFCVARYDCFRFVLVRGCCVYMLLFVLCCLLCDAGV